MYELLLLVAHLVCDKACKWQLANWQQFTSGITYIYIHRILFAVSFSFLELYTSNYLIENTLFSLLFNYSHSVAMFKYSFFSFTVLSLVLYIP